MLRSVLPKITLFCLIFCFNAFGQKKMSAEVVLTKCWSYPTENGRRIATDGIQIYLGTADAKIEALSFEGKKLWTAELGGEINSNIAVGNAGVFVATAPTSAESGQTTLRSLSKETGVTNWTVKLSAASDHSLYISNASLLVVSKSGVVQSINARDGSVKWRREIAEGFVAKPSFSVDRIVVATVAKQVFAINIESGEISSVKKYDVGVTCLLSGGTSDLFIGDERGSLLHFAGGAEKAAWKFRSGGSVSAIFSVNGAVLIASHDNFAYLISSSGGGTKWKRRLTGRASWIATYEDKFAVLAGADDHSAQLIDLSNGKTAGQILLGEDELVAYDPVVTSGTIYLLTDRSAYSYSLGACAK